MSLPDNWVDRIFSKLTLAYGAPFMRQYDGLPINEVKADWAETLAPFSQSPAAIAYGLERLPPDRPPNAMQFRELCRRPNGYGAPALPAPKGQPVDPEVARATREAFHRKPGQTMRWWAEKLRDRELGGERLTQFQREAWRFALSVEHPIEERV